MKRLALYWQLRRAGVAHTEARDLARLAATIPAVPALSSTAKQRIAEELGIAPVRFIHPIRYATAGGLLVLAALVGVSQSAQPSTPVLYTIKRGSEEVRVLLQPGFDRADVQQRREAERQKAAEPQQHQVERNHGSTRSDNQHKTSDEHRGSSQPTTEQSQHDVQENAQKLLEDAQKAAEEQQKQLEESNSGSNTSGSNSGSTGGSGGGGDVSGSNTSGDSSGGSHDSGSGH